MNVITPTSVPLYLDRLSRFAGSLSNSATKKAWRRGEWHKQLTVATGEDHIVQ